MKTINFNSEKASEKAITVFKRFYVTLENEAKITAEIKKEKEDFEKKMEEIASGLGKSIEDVTEEDLASVKEYPVIFAAHEDNMKALKVSKSDNNKKQKDCIGAIIDKNMYVSYLAGIDACGDFSETIPEFTLEEKGVKCTYSGFAPLKDYIYNIFKALGGQSMTEENLAEASQRFACLIGSKMLTAADVVAKGEFVGGYKKAAFGKASMQVLLQLLVKKYGFFEIKGGKLVVVNN